VYLTEFINSKQKQNKQKKQFFSSFFICEVNGGGLAIVLDPEKTKSINAARKNRFGEHMHSFEFRSERGERHTALGKHSRSGAVRLRSCTVRICSSTVCSHQDSGSL